MLRREEPQTVMLVNLAIWQGLFPEFPMPLD